MLNQQQLELYSRNILLNEIGEIGQQRLLQINDSYRKKQAAYIKIIIIVIVALLLLIVLQFLSTNFTFIPEII